VSALGVALLAGLLIACAGSGVKNNKRYVAEEDVIRPPVLLVYDFAVHPSDVSAGAASYGYSEESDLSDKELKEGREMANAVSEALVAKLRERGVRARRASRHEEPPLHALLLEGQFVTIKKGSALARTVIGFGAGSTKLEARVQAYQATESGLHRIADADVSAHGSRKPGMAVPVAGGAAMGTAAVSAAVSGGLSVVSEVQGKRNPDASRMAEQIAERVAGFYERRGWL
jgi:hypothetical protein